MLIPFVFGSHERMRDLERRVGSIARSGLPVIVPVTEFRDILGVAITNIAGGADVETELKKGNASAQAMHDKANAG